MGVNPGSKISTVIAERVKQSIAMTTFKEKYVYGIVFMIHDEQNY